MEIVLYLSELEASILLEELKEIVIKTTTTKWVIKYLEHKLEKGE